MAWYSKIRSLFGQQPVHEAAGRGRSLAWMPGNPGAVAAMLATNTELRIKSRDLVRRNAWAQAGIEAFVSNAVGTGIKPQSCLRRALQADVQALWRDWTEEADAAGQTDFYGLQALACRAMLEGGECLIRLRRAARRMAWWCPAAAVAGARAPADQSEHDLPSGNVVRSGIEFDSLGRRVATTCTARTRRTVGWLRCRARAGWTRCASMRRKSSTCSASCVPARSGASRGCRGPGQAQRTRPVRRRRTGAQEDRRDVRGLRHAPEPEDNLMGEGAADADGIALAGLEPGTLQILEPGEDIKFSDPADVGGSYGEFLRTVPRGCRRHGITYEQLTGDLTA
jgi:capsid protein